MTRPRLLMPLLLLAVLAPPAQAAETVLAPAANTAAITAYDGHVVLSRLDPATNRWSLVRWHNGVVDTLPVAPARRAVRCRRRERAAGKPVVVYSRCAQEPPASLRARPIRRMAARPRLRRLRTAADGRAEGAQARDRQQRVAVRDDAVDVARRARLRPPRRWRRDAEAPLSAGRLDEATPPRWRLDPDMREHVRTEQRAPQRRPARHRSVARGVRVAHDRRQRVRRRRRSGTSTPRR